MPIWLVTFLTGIIEPIVEKLVVSLLLKMQLNKLAADRAKATAGFEKLASAQTDEERDAGLNDIASSWNH